MNFACDQISLDAASQYSWQDWYGPPSSCGMRAGVKVSAEEATSSHFKTGLKKMTIISENSKPQSGYMAPAMEPNTTPAAKKPKSGLFMPITLDNGILASSPVPSFSFSSTCSPIDPSDLPESKDILGSLAFDLRPEFRLADSISFPPSFPTNSCSSTRAR